jgi:MFS family permease
MKFIPIFVANLFFSLHYNAIVYVNSSFLDDFFTRSTIGGLYILGSIANLLLFIEAPRSLRRLGNRHFFLFLVSLEMLAVVILAGAFSPLITALAFIMLQGVSIVTYYALDIFLEDATHDRETGRVRGAFLTIINLTLVFSPLLISLLAPHGEFHNVYLASILFLLPVLFIGLFGFKRFNDGAHRDMRLPVGKFLDMPDIRRVTFVRFVLDVFYAFMVIYMPLYLHQTIGFSWETIGVIFAFMLLPFILFELPAGELADAGFGEKEMMTLGLFIMGTSLVIMPFLKSPDAFNWAVILFMSRVGASFTEIMTETYFFKHVDKSNTGLISIFRSTWPLGFMAMPALATITLALFPFPALFLVLGIVIYKAMESSALLTDTH